MNGKGSNRRPFNRKKYDNNYDHAFGKRSRDGRRRDLAALQTTVYTRIKNIGPHSHVSLVAFTEAEPEDVSIALQALKKAGSIRYCKTSKVWCL